MIGVLLRKAEAAATGTVMRASAPRTLRAVPRVARTIGCSAPLFSTARAST